MTKAQETEITNLPKGETKKIFVNPYYIEDNDKRDRDFPPISVQTGQPKLDRKGHRVDVVGESGEILVSIIYDRHYTEASGAKVWVESDQEVLIHLDKYPHPKSRGDLNT